MNEWVWFWFGFATGFSVLATWVLGSVSSFLAILKDTARSENKKASRIPPQGGMKP